MDRNAGHLEGAGGLEKDGGKEGKLFDGGREGNT